MSTRSSAPTGLIVAAFGALGVLASLWLPWYLIRIPQAFRDMLSNLGGGAAQPGAAPSPGTDLSTALGGVMKGLAAAIPNEITGTGWQVMHGGDVALAVIAGAALLIVMAVVGGLTGVKIELGAAGRFVAALGAVAVAIAVYHVVSRPGSGTGGFTNMVSVKYGIWVAVAGGVAMVAGGLTVGRSVAHSAASAGPAGFAPPITPAAAPERPMPWDTAASAPPPAL